MRAGWVRLRLGEVTSKIGSGATPRGGEASYKKTGISLIRSLNVHDTGFRTKDLAFIGDEQAAALSNVTVEPWDVLLNITGASVARCCVVPNDMLPARVNQHVSILRPMGEQLSPRFLHYMLVSKQYKARLLDAGDGGATRQALTKAQLQDFSIEFPVALSEQQRIVAILDEAFTGIATAKANAEKSLQNARELFETEADEIVSGANGGWTKGTLEKFCESISTGPFGSLLHKSDYAFAGVPLVNPINIVGEDIVADSRKLIDQATAERLRGYVLKQGDIVIGRRGEIGRCAVVGDEQDGWMCGTGCFFIRPLDSVNPYFLARLMRSRTYREMLESTSTGATMMNLSNKALASLVVSMPAYSLQIELLEKIDALGERVAVLESTYNRKLAALDELKQSLLAKAFAGEL